MPMQPTFGARHQDAAYYLSVFDIIDIFRLTSTLREMADSLNLLGLSTPTGLPWTRTRVSNFIRTTPRSFAVEAKPA